MHPHTIYIEFGYGQRLALTEMQSGVPFKVCLQQQTGGGLDGWEDAGKPEQAQLAELIRQTIIMLGGVVSV